MSSWERGYGDFEMVAGPRHAAAASPGTRARRCAWPTCAGPTTRRSSPRRGRSCARQLERLAERGLEAFAGTELEFIVFRDTYEEAFEKGYRDLEPANQYNVDYSLLGHRAGGAADPPHPQRRWPPPGCVVENSKGECNDGQHEINFRYGPALQAADEHAIYKTGAKEIAAQEGMAITFMAKFDEREGTSCHIHLSLRRDDGARCSSTSRRSTASSPASSPACAS